MTRNLDLLTESVISLQQAVKLLPNRPRRETVWRWTHRGVGGITLETVQIGREILTSEEAVHRFIAAINDRQPVKV